MHGFTKALLTASTLFMLIEFGLLCFACIAQFQRVFLVQEAMALIGLAFLSAICATIFSFGAMVSCGFKNRLVNFKPVIIWIGFGFLALIGIMLHEFFIVSN